MPNLKNRFNQDELMSAWAFHFRCLWCGKSGADCFHHIISPSSHYYISGKFNTSILNSCPIHNFSCHIGNGDLHKIDNEKILLRKVYQTLVKNNYILNQKDKKFLEIYSELYELDLWKNGA